MSKDLTGREGVNAVATAVNNDLEWFFREQPIHDYGIDGHIEIVKDDIPTGQLIAVQIKSGRSHFHVTEQGLTFYFDDKHRDYWLEGSLPVILCAYIPEEKTVYWQSITKEMVQETKTGNKLSIPFAQKFDKSAKRDLMLLAKGTPQQRNLNILHESADIMRYIHAGGDVFIEFQHFPNKTLSIRGIQFLIKLPHDDERYVNTKWADGMCVVSSVDEFLNCWFPWANLRIDHSYYEENFQPDVNVLNMIFGEEIRELEDFSEDDIFPYRVYCGEIEFFRLRLTLNDLGVAYLQVMNFARAH